MLHLRAHSFAPHIRRIGHDDVIPLGERLGLFEHAQDFEVRLAQEELAAEVLRLDGAAGEGDGPFVEARLDEGAEVLRLLELVEKLYELRIADCGLRIGISFWVIGAVGEGRSAIQNSSGSAER